MSVGQANFCGVFHTSALVRLTSVEVRPIEHVESVSGPIPKKRVDSTSVSAVPVVPGIFDTH